MRIPLKSATDSGVKAATRSTRGMPPIPGERRRLIWRFGSVEGGKTLDTYWSSAFPGCAMRKRCTTGKYRRIKRRGHEAVLEAARERLDRKPETKRMRRQTVEHPFGPIKSWIGYTHFAKDRCAAHSGRWALAALHFDD